MKINDYRHADCKLFRMPSIDVTVIDKQLEKTIVEAWKNGGNAQQTVDNLVQNSEVLGQLSGQIAQNVEFQKQNALRNSEMQHDERVRAHEEVYSGKINELEEVVGAQTEEQKSKLTQLDQSLQEKQQGYTAAQAQLEEMRARIKKKLGDLGGKKAFEKLINIKETMQKPQQQTQQTTAQTTNQGEQSQTTNQEPQNPNYTPQTPNYQPPTTNYDPQINTSSTPSDPQTPSNISIPVGDHAKANKLKDLESALKTVESEGPIDPLNKKTKDYETVKEAKLEEKKGFVRRFFAKTWEIMNYKLW
ncbi:hypothetical protein HZA97_08285 [Candidatus Woesearchaeota archaeon]|nr:hypothetical protein [Candidatus Woesearchaeota archaeon]